MDSLLEHAADVESLAVLSRFRLDFHSCLVARSDELFELADAVLCADGPVRTLGVGRRSGFRRREVVAALGMPMRGGGGSA